MDPRKIRWGSTEYTLRAFTDKYKDSFPKLIKVTEGFLGQQEMDSISASTLMHVQSLLCQRRAVFESRQRVLSLPVSISTMAFYLIKNETRKDGPLSLSVILESSPLPVTVQPETPLMVLGTQSLDTLTITSTYQEELLLGYPLSNAGFVSGHTPLVLPVYMDEVRVCLAEGLRGVDQDTFEAIHAAQARLIPDRGLYDFFVFQDITILDTKRLTEYEHEYMEVEPTYTRLNKQDDKILLNQRPPVPAKPPHLSSLPSRIKPSPALLEMNSASQVTLQVSSVSPLSSLAEVPGDLRRMSVEEVCACLRLLNLSQYCPAFQQEQIDGDLLLAIEPGAMRECLGMNDLHVTKLLSFREGWRPRLEPSDTSSV